MKLFCVLYSIALLSLSGCVNKSKSQTRPFESQSLSDSSYAHFIYFADGFDSDSTILIMNDSLLFEKRLKTNTAGFAGVIKTNESGVHKLYIKSFSPNKLFIDTLYRTKDNAMYFIVAKGTKHFAIYESQKPPVFW